MFTLLTPISRVWNRHVNDGGTAEFVSESETLTPVVHSTGVSPALGISITSLGSWSLALAEDVADLVYDVVLRLGSHKEIFNCYVGRKRQITSKTDRAEAAERR